MNKYIKVLALFFASLFLITTVPLQAWGAGENSFLAATAGSTQTEAAVADAGEAAETDTGEAAEPDAGVAAGTNAGEAAEPDAGEADGTASGESADHTEETASGTEAKTYKVLSDDSLWKIAQDQYGDGSKWNMIYEANKDEIHDPGLIYPGQELKIPNAA